MSVAYLRIPHDSSFKRFVFNPNFIRHLLRAYPLPALKEADVTAIEDARANLVDQYLKQRLIDAVWRLRTRDGGIAYLLIECQARVDPAMPVRMLDAAAAL